MLLPLLLMLQLQALFKAAGACVPVEEGVVSEASLLFTLLPAAGGIEDA